MKKLEILKCIRVRIPYGVTIALSVLISYKNEGFFCLCKAILVFEVEVIFRSVRLNFGIIKNTCLKQKYPIKESTPVYAKLMTT